MQPVLPPDDDEAARDDDRGSGPRPGRRQVAEEPGTQEHRPQQAGIVHRHHQRDRRQSQRPGQGQLREPAREREAGEDGPGRGVVGGREMEHQQAQGDQRADCEPEYRGRGAFRRAQAPDDDGHRCRKQCCGKRNRGTGQGHLAAARLDD